MKRITEQDLIGKLAVRADRKFGLTVLAKELGFSVQFIWGVLHGKRRVTDKLASSMGYKKITYYIKVGSEN